MSREQMIAELKKIKPSYNYDRYEDAQIFRMYQRYVLDKNAPKSDVVTQQAEPTISIEKSIEDYEKEYEDQVGYKTCGTCGTRLNDMGTCPRCDEGEEDFSLQESSKSVFEIAALKIISYLRKNTDRYDSNTDLFELLDDLNICGIFDIPKSAPGGFECEDPENVTEEEAEEYINLLISNTDLKNRLDKEFGDYDDLDERLTENRQNPYFTPYGYRDSAKVLNGKAPEYYYHLKHIEMDTGDGIKLAKYALRKGLPVMVDKNSDPDYPEFAIKGEYHWDDYFYPYPTAHEEDLVAWDGKMFISSLNTREESLDDYINEEYFTIEESSEPEIEDLIDTSNITTDIETDDDFNLEKTCVLCGNKIFGYGNNAAPVADGICCDLCNMEKVIPARLNQFRSKRK